MFNVYIVNYYNDTEEQPSGELNPHNKNLNTNTKDVKLKIADNLAYH